MTAHNPADNSEDPITSVTKATKPSPTRGVETHGADTDQGNTIAQRQAVHTPVTGKVRDKEPDGTPLDEPGEPGQKQAVTGQYGDGPALPDA